MGAYIRLLAVSLMVLFAFTADAAGAKDRFTYFAEAQFFLVDSTDIETSVFVTAIDHPAAQDVLSVQVVRSNPACADPAAGCDFILLSSFGEASVAEKDVRVQHSLRWARVDASVEFTDQISGSTIPVTIDLEWTSIGDFAPEFHDGSGFRRAAALGTIRVADDELLGGLSDSGAEISRFIL